MTKFHYRARRFSAFLVGLVFFVAGALKLMDPVGAGLVVTEYLKFFHLAFMLPAAKVVGVLLALVEAVTGAALVTGVFRKLFAITATVMVGFFTVVTFILWIKNPAFDCGCFGEAIHLSHGQTLVKNLILCALSALAFIPFKGYGKGRGGKMVSFFLVCAAILFITVRNWMYIPFKDFTPFKATSVLLAADWENPENPELAFTDAEGFFCDSLATKGYVMVCSAPEPSRMSAGQWSRTSALLEDAQAAGFTPLLLVSAEPGSAFLPQELDPKDYMLLSQAAYFADYRTLVSLNRSCGGATYFHEGELIRKWAARALPSAEELKEILNSDPTEVTISAQTRGSICFQAFFLYSLAVLFLI